MCENEISLEGVIAVAVSDNTPVQSAAIALIVRLDLMRVFIFVQILCYEFNDLFEQM